MKKKRNLITAAVTLFLLICALIPSSALAARPALSGSRYLKTYPISTANNTAVYSNSGCTRKIATVKASDELYVTSIGSKWAYCSYPTARGRKYGYVKLSSITPNNYSATGKATRKVNFYKRSNLKQYYGYASAGSSIWVIGKKGSAVQVICSSGSTYKMGWVSLTNYNKYMKQAAASSLRITAYSTPGTMNRGSSFSLRGTIVSNYKITKITVGIYNSRGTAVSSRTVRPNSNSYNISRLSAYIRFSKAQSGTNYLRITASDTRRSNVRLLNVAFTVRR